MASTVATRSTRTSWPPHVGASVTSEPPRSVRISRRWPRTSPWSPRPRSPTTSSPTSSRPRSSPLPVLALHVLSATDAAAALRARRVTSRALVEACLERIAALESVVRAWTVVDGAGAMATADRLDAEARSGRFRGPLHGVPVGIKDIFHVAGPPDTGGHPRDRGRRAGGRRRERRPAAGRRGRHPRQAPHHGVRVRRPRAHGQPLEPLPHARGDRRRDRRRPWPRAWSRWPSARRPWGPPSGRPPSAASSASSPSYGADQPPWRHRRRLVARSRRHLHPERGRRRSRVDRPRRRPATRRSPAASGTDAGRHGAIGRRLAAAAPRARPRALLGAGDARHAGARRVGGRAPRRGRRAAGPRAAARPSWPPSCRPSRCSSAPRPPPATRTSTATTPTRYRPQMRAAVEAGLCVPAEAYLRAQRLRRHARRELVPLLRAFDALLMPAAPGVAPRTCPRTGDPSFNAPWSGIGAPQIALPIGLRPTACPSGSS